MVSKSDIDRERQTVGPYHVDGVLGQGGMGVVYRGKEADGRPVAIKVLRPSANDDASGARRFAREARIRIEHPNVVALLDAGVDEADGSPWIAFELLEGLSLRQRLSRGLLSAAETLELGMQVCSGLEAAHGLGVVHRDLKPSNLFICQDGTVKLLDFGVARWAAVDPELTASNQVIGTPSYLAPEQARGDARIDLRADLWALGIVLYESLTGRKPFKRASPVSTMLAIVLEDPAPLGNLRRDIPSQLVAAVHRCLDKDPSQRFASADELREVLSQIEAPDGGVAAQGLITVPDGEGGSAAETIATMSMRATQVIVEGEERLVAVLLAEGVRDAAAIERAVVERDGVFIPLLARRQAIGLFGGEAWEGDEVVRAASAALLARDAAKWISVASGRARAAGAGIAGQVVLAAERACASKVAGVAIAPEAAPLLLGGFSLGELPDGTWELTGDRNPFWPLGAQNEGAETETVGRTVETEQLKRTLDRVLDEELATTVLVTGPPGIGKTRLRREMERLLEQDARTITVIAGRAEPLRREAAYALLRTTLESRARLGAMLRGWPRIDAEANEEERQQGVRALVLEVEPDPARVEENAGFLGELLGVPMPESAALVAARRDPQLMADRLHMAVVDYFVAACEQGPVALLLDDLQWADEASIGVLDELLDRLGDYPLLLLATARPELDDRWPGLFRDGGATRIQLSGLSTGEVRTLAASIAGRPLTDAVTNAVMERTGGNPFFVEQIVTELKERDLLDKGPEDLPLPLTVEAAVQSRLDHLPRHEKELCKRAAIYGRPFTSEEVAALGLADTEALLTSLARRELVSGRSRGRAGRGREYRFRSSLIVDVAYRLLADELRIELHRRAAGVLEAQPGCDPEEVAAHYESGQLREEAAKRYAEAALAAARRGDSQTVLRCSGRALDLHVDTGQPFALHMARADALRFLGRRADQAPELEAAHASAASDVEHAQVLVEQAVWMSRTGRSADAIEAAQAAVAAARAAGDRELLVLARGRQATVLVLAGRLTEAEEALVEASGLAVGVSPGARAFVAEWRGLLANALGDLGMQVEAYQSAVAQYEEVGDLRRSAGAENNVADAYNRVGEYVEAEKALRATVDKCRRVGNHLVEAYALVNLGYSLAMQGRNDDALEAIAEAEKRARASKDVRLALFARVYRVRTLLGAEPPPEEERKSWLEGIAQEAEDAADGAVDLGLPGIRALALTIAARALLGAGETARALERSTAAMAVRDEMGSLEEDEADVFATHARALLAGGRPDDADTVRARGRERIEELAARIRGAEWRERFMRGIAARGGPADQSEA